MIAPLRIAYLMEDTDLSGGVRVQLAQADAMIARGHRVTIFTKGLPLTWRSSEAEWEYVDDFRGPSYDEFDFVIGDLLDDGRAGVREGGRARAPSLPGSRVHLHGVPADPRGDRRRVPPADPQARRQPAS